MKPALATLLLLELCLQAQETHALTLKSRIELANVNGRIDHFSADVKGLFVAVPHRGTQRAELLIFDTK